MRKSSLHLRRITVSAIFLSLSLIIKSSFTFYVPMFGQNGMSIGVSGIFSMMPGILFGPIFGAAVSGLQDILGFILKPAGSFLPFMTLIVALGGFIRGAIWMLLRNKSSMKMRIAVAAISVAMLVSGVLNYIYLSADGVNASFYDNVKIEDVNIEGMHAISKLLIQRTINTSNPGKNLETYIFPVTAGLVGSALFGLILLAADLIISRLFLKDAQKGQTMQMLIALLVSGLIVTTLNTILLRETIYTSWKALPFAAVWIPRAIEEILGNTLKAYFMAVLLGIFNEQRNLKELMI
ncbi:hypothetical protein OXPF_17290 [Oxobacter pfennigii]|uniref:ECF transporter S component n=1 Tax=Oxobacter pfennigii TaxID=36849 RepID=A0A0P8WQ01_9CLOT|nr:hypothetical protein OXPF_17290 [Oxobacter pfennigii]